MNKTIFGSRIRTLLGILALGLAASALSADPALPNPIVKAVDFRDVKLQDALRILADQTGINMVASTEASKTPVTMSLHDVPVKLAVDTLCKSHNLSYKDDTGIVRVMTVPEFQRDISTYKAEVNKVFQLLYPNAVAIATGIRDLYGDRVILGLSSEDQYDQTNQLNENFDRFDIIDQRSQGLGIFGGGNGVSTVGGYGGGGGRYGGGGFNSSNFSGGSFTQRSYLQQQNTQRRRDDQNANQNRTYREDLDKMTADDAAALKQAQEKNDAATIDRIIKQYRRQQADIYVTINRRSNLLAIRTSDDKSLEEISKLIRRMDVPTSTVLLEVKVMSIELGKDLNSAFDFQFTDGRKTAGSFTSGNIQPPGADLIGGDLRRFAPLNLGGTGLQDGALAFQYVDRNFRARLQALENKNKVTTLATPVLMTANNEVSRLFVGEERPIVRNIGTNNVVNDNTVVGGSNTQIEFRPVGTTLLITPNINADRTVTLRILQENSMIKKNDAIIPVVTSDGSVQQQPVDVVATRSVSGTVIARDMLTLAIGGLIEESISRQKAQVPLLGDIPGVGVIFRRDSKNKTRSELVILIRPRILTTPCEGEAVSKELLDQLSIHPKAQNPEGTLGLYGPADVLPNCKDK